MIKLWTGLLRSLDFLVLLHQGKRTDDQFKKKAIPRCTRNDTIALEKEEKRAAMVKTK